MDNVLTLSEHKEFAKRMEDEHKRQNTRIASLEEKYEEQIRLISSVESLATSIENMQLQLANQGKKLEKLESRDGEMWRKVVGYIATAIIGIVVGFIFKQIGM